MNKYKIVSVPSDGKVFLCDVVVKGPNGQRKLSVMPYVVKGAKVGDVIREYRDKGDMITIAYSCRGRMQFNMRPNSDYRFRTFAEEHLTWHEKMLLNIGMCRALCKRNIRPTLSFENNLRLLVGESIRIR